VVIVGHAANPTLRAVMHSRELKALAELAVGELNGLCFLALLAVGCFVLKVFNSFVR